MKIEVVPVKLEEKEILRNLLEKYDYEFSQYDKRDVNSLGLYGYDWLDCYWTDKDRWAFFVKADDKLAGFAMVNKYFEERKDNDFSMSEFFVMYKYRRQGVGRYLAFYLFDKFKGKWEVKRHPKNINSVYFWDNIIKEYTNNNCEIILSNPKIEYDDGTFADIIYFNSGTKEE